MTRSKAKLGATPIKTAVFRPNTNLEEFIWKYVKGKLKANCILAITSKIVSIAESQLLPIKGNDKSKVIKDEADFFICNTSFGVSLTIKHGLLIPSAGIDESNSENNEFILFPKNPYESAKNLWDYLNKKSGITKFGIIITDSHTTPLRKGVSGIALAHWGFKATKSYVGAKDIFGRKLQMTSVNVLDALSVSAVLVMGESSEQQPLALLEYQDIEFCKKTSSADIQIPIEEDLYGPLLLSRGYKRMPN